jgi:hypothetical protein
VGSKKKKKIFVSSETYNLAGPENKRDNVLKNTLLATILAENRPWLGETITNSYLKGQGVKLRNFSNWATRSGFTANVIKQTGGTLSLPQTIPNHVVQGVLNPADPEKVSISFQTREIADETYWVMQYLLENRPKDLDGNWVSTYDEVANLVTIHFLGGDPIPEVDDGELIFPEQDEDDDTPIPEPEIIETVSFTPADYVVGADYLYVVYSVARKHPDGELLEDAEVIVGSGSFPSVSGYDHIGTTTQEKNFTLETKTVVETSYTDGTPTEIDTTTSTTSATRIASEAIYEKKVYQGSYTEADDDGLYNYSLWNQTKLYVDFKIETTSTTSSETHPIAGGHFKTITTTVYTDTLVANNSYKQSQQDVNINGWSPARMYIYRLGSGNSELDAYIGSTQSVGEFFPHIPLRVWKKNVSDSYYETIYTEGNKALKRSIDSSMQKMHKLINSSESEGDIDHAFINYAVPINVKNDSGKKYIYLFFKQFLAGQNPTQYQQWENTYNEETEIGKTWAKWSSAQKDNTDPLFGTPEPPRPAIPAAPSGSFSLKSGHSDIDFDITISWSSIKEEIFVGKFKSDAKRNQLWIQQGQTIFDTNIPVEIVWQHDYEKYRKITLTGLNYNNYVYGGRSVSYTGHSEVKNGSESKFQFPLHNQIIREMGLVDFTQMSTACTFIIFNSYQIVKVKKKWYQSSIFKVVLVIVIVVETVFFPPAGGALGATSGVGGAVGSTAVAAGASAAVGVAIAAAVNMVVAIVVTSILSKVATKAFGEKWGGIIGTIASIFVMQGLNSQFGSSGAGASNGWADAYRELMKPNNLMKVAQAIGEGMQAGVAAKLQKYHDETQAIIADYEAESERIAQLFMENIGDGSSVDIVKIQQMVAAFDYRKEWPNEFLQRTLLVGSDVVELAQSMVDDFATITTTLELP